MPGKLRRPLVVNLPPQAWQANRLAQGVGEGPDPFWMEREFENAGLDLETIDPNSRPWNPFAGRHGAYMGIDPLRALRVLLTRRRAGLILAGSESPSLVITALRRLLLFRPPVMIWELSWSPGWKFREWLCRQTVPRADSTVVVGTNQIALVRQEFGPRARPVFAPLYTDVDFFQPQAGAEAESERAPYVFSIGLDRGRDFDLLIKATEGLGRQLKIKAGRYDLPVDRARFPHVEVIDHFLPYRAIRDLYDKASVVAITTLDTPNACGVTSLMEAMAMGKSVVVSDNPALADYLPPSTAEAVIVVPIGDAEAVRSAITFLLENPDAALAMGKRARAFAVERFHPRPNLKYMTDLCWQIIRSSQR
jgi:glycosyltransferase involved in cell wall biosynthesis